MNQPDNTIHLNRARKQFELLIEDKLSFVAYLPVDDQTLAITHTEVHPDLEGQGIGSRLVKSVLEYVEKHDLSIVPLCPFVATYLKRHPEYQSVVSEEYDENDFR